MKVIKISNREYKVKKGNKVVAIIFERNGKWNAVEGNLCVKADRKSAEECLVNYIEYYNNSIEELTKRIITI